MTGAAAWIGPAIVAAVTSALVTGAGWFVSERQARRREALRRRERIVDVQTALLAEIRASRHRLGNLDDHAAAMEAAFRASADYSPFVPRPVAPFVLDALISDIHVLPTYVIDSVVIYYRQVASVASFVDDITGERFAQLEAARKQLIYRDYIELLREADRLSLAAEAAIFRSLNIPDAGPSDPRSGAAPGAGSETASVTRSTSSPIPSPSDEPR